LKQGDALSPFPFNFALEYGIRRVQANQRGLKLNGKHHLLVYADIVNILVASIHTTRKNTADLKVANKETGIEVNAEKTKYLVRSRNQNAGQNHNMLLYNKPFERVGHLKYLGTTNTNHYSIHEEIKSRLKSVIARNLSVQNLSSSNLLSKNINTKI
jgi:hypothetical protein